MADEAREANPAEQLVELLVYAPVGFLYEYREVLPQLVKRGKSQVQLARVVGQMAASRGQSDPGAAVGDLATIASGLVAKLVTEIGSQVGLAPPAPAGPAATPAKTNGGDTESADEPKPSKSKSKSKSTKAPKTPEASRAPKPLPIARYDELTAREIIPLLEDLTQDQRRRVGAHEATNRKRKTVLAKLDRLAP